MPDVRIDQPVFWSHGPIDRIRRRLAPLKEGLGDLIIGRDVFFATGPVRTLLAVFDGGRLTIGDHVVIGHGVSVSCSSTITIGDDCRIAAFTHIIDSDFHVAGDADALAEPGPITIGRGVVIGECVTVLRNAVIGDEAVIEPGSVVLGVVPSGACVGGVPATVRRTEPTGKRQ